MFTRISSKSRQTTHAASSNVIGYVVLLILCLAVYTDGQRILVDEIQRQYVRQGIPYRENVFLDNLPILAEYDFVIIGSGPAGSVLANRLTEVADWSVLLMEQGPEGNIYNDIPFINPLTVLGNHTKFYLVEKTENACNGLIGGRCNWPAGEVVGGASIINGMIYTRGHPTDFDGWNQEGNAGWSYGELLPYFRKLENMSITNLADSKYHGNNGPINIEYPFLTGLGGRFIRAGREIGMDYVDYNNPNSMLGISRTQATMRGGRRDSAVKGYLMPIKSRPNLHVSKNTLATELVIDPQTKRAYGVKFVKNRVERVVFVRKEVIVSAGAFNSPKLLMLSGIGRREHLEESGIPVVEDLPVGDNLQEHLGTPLLSYLINTTDSIVFSRLIPMVPTYFLQWLSGNRGLLSNNAAEALAYVKTPLATNKADIEFIFLPLTGGSDGGAMLRKTLSLGDEQFKAIWEGNYFRDGFSIGVMGMYPKSRGKIRLRSKDYKDAPIIDGNFFDDPYDVKVIVEGIKIARRLAESKAFAEIGARQYRRPVKLCSRFKFNSDEYWDCAVRAVPIQFHHQCCTNRMGPSPLTSVVDPRLRVHGILGLRVIDASVMPNIPGTHTMSPSYLIGEKGADLIKEDWALSYK